MDIEELHATAELAQLVLSDTEAAALSEAVTQMVDYFARMQEIDVDDLPPTTHALLTRNRVRPDAVRQSAVADALLERAPDLEDRFVVIPNVL
ncbi:MAG: Asp-tRNA(Asn)/Glu-tRNA(Gln) amidotransferase subunit GatC [Spirochaetaceae bacterium]|nr:MAG: Asp-tRNA(Asn)/Glu-tRNA(Gln) amidotransferase subunit GatC [Spirochaetaceae bacterium]